MYLSEIGRAGWELAVDRLKERSFEIGPIRPPSEGGSFSLLLRATRNCPWNRCTFCTAYKHERFELRSVAEIKADIDSARAISDEIQALSWKLGYAGKIEPLDTTLQSKALYGKDTQYLTSEEFSHFLCVVNVFSWLCSGGKTAFLQDANTTIMRTHQLVEVISYLKETFPSLERVTSYARSKTITQKKPGELSQLRQAGLSRLHIGLETGDDELLSYIDKGVTAEEHIVAGKKALEAGFELSLYVMPGLGGRSRSVQHARNTARVLNEINPHFIRLRTFVPREGTPLFEAYQKGEFGLTSPHERLREISLMIESLQVTSRVCFDHNLNPSYWSGGRLTPLLKPDYDGYKFPEEKGIVLARLDQGLQFDENVFLDARNIVNEPHL
ncbi:MAG: radical SAM protein [Chloroflexi bacterium]|nr:radical SAM protein [Chloroflexota bacterium]